jgi:Tfp pilus assembly protein FimT
VIFEQGLIATFAAAFHLPRSTGKDMHLSDDHGYSVLEVLFAAAISATLAAVAIPMSRNSVGYFRLSGDARSVSNAVALTKMRAASAFSQARLYVDLSTRSHHIETYTKGVGFSGTQGSTGLSQSVSLSSGSLSTPPPNTQSVIGQAPACRTSAGAAIANTACIVFNSRGIPINCTSIVLDQGCSPAAPTADDAVYLTDGTAVYGVTVAASGMIQMWRSAPSTVSWIKQ